MKILLIRNLNPFYDSSASGNRFASLVLGLKKYGANVSIAVTGGYNNLVEKNEMGEGGYYDSIKIVYLVKLLNDTLWKRRVNKYFLSFVNELLIKYKLERIINEGYDYIWLTQNYSILKYYNENHDKIKNSLLEINEFHDIYKQVSSTNKAQYKYAKETEHEFLVAIKTINHFAVMTNKLLEYQKKISNKEAFFLHLPMTVDLDRFDSIKKKNTDKYIAFAGSLANRKDGVDILIDSFIRISKKYQDLNLYIAGPNHPDFNEQKMKIKKNGLENRIKYLGVLSRDEIPPFFKNAIVLALPRPDSHQAEGGFPTKLGEYLATKNPVCVTSVGEITCYLEHRKSAFIAEPGNVESFVKCLDEALTNYSFAKDVGYNGFMVAKKFFDKDVQGMNLYNFLNNNLIR